MLKKLLLATALSGLVLSGVGVSAAPDASDAASNGKFIAAQTTDQWVFSKFKGSDVLGPNNEHIGSVSDLLFDKSGKIMGVVVGVGGVLGIGQKNVAIDMSAFEVVPAGTGNATTQVPSAAANDPTDVSLKVSWTKDQLQAAPDFQYYKPPAATTGIGRTNGLGKSSPMTPRPQ
jgi:hypothetical protein